MPNTLGSNIVSLTAQRRLAEGTYQRTAGILPATKVFTTLVKLFGRVLVSGGDA